MNHWLAPAEKIETAPPEDVLELTKSMRVKEPAQKKDPKFQISPVSLSEIWAYTKLAGLAFALNQSHAALLENFGARADWQPVGRCEISGYISTNGKPEDVESIGTVFTSDKNYKPEHGEVDVRHVESSTDPYRECRKILLTKGFNLWSIELSHGKAIPGVLGMDGQTKGAINTGNRVEGSSGDIKGAIALTHEVERDSLAIEQEWKGVAFTSAWYKNEWQKITGTVGEWQDASVQSIKQGYTRTIDNTISMLQKAKPAP